MFKFKKGDIVKYNGVFGPLYMEAVDISTDKSSSSPYEIIYIQGTLFRVEGFQLISTIPREDD